MSAGIEAHILHIVDGTAEKCGCEYQCEPPFWKWVWTQIVWGGA